MKIATATVCLFFSVFLGFAEELQLGGGAFAFRSEINSDRVNVREYPSLAGKVIAKLSTASKVIVTGISRNADRLDGHNGYWLRVNWSQDKPFTSGYGGWVYSKYVKDCADLQPRKMSASQSEGDAKLSPPKLHVSSSNSNSTIEHIVYLIKVPSQEFCTFSINDNTGDCSYDEIPGTYAWFPETNEVKHLTYIGSPNSPAYLTDDLKYVLQPSMSHFSTKVALESRPRIAVWTVSTGAKVFEGFSVDPNLNMHDIDIVYYYAKGSPEKFDAETVTHATEFWANNQAPWLDTETMRFVVVKYRLNLDTMDRQFQNCEYVIYSLLEQY